jgi:hypothetical protein
MDVITIRNNGPELVATDFFDSAGARQGLCYLSWNAGAARLLLPDVWDNPSLLAELATGRLVVISRGKLHGVEAYEIMFDDGSETPFAFHIDARQSDRLVPAREGEFIATAWTRRGKVGTWPARYRIVPTLPCLQPHPDA